ncbi:MAG: ATP-binding protein [Actinobacteria bacterium]|nr:ATP-binding protein [Actinomycetota bacterium]
MTAAGTVSGWGARAVVAAPRHSLSGPPSQGAPPDGAPPHAAPPFGAPPQGAPAPGPPPPAPDTGLPGSGPAGDWPLRDFTELSAWPGAVPQARAHAGELLCRWGLAGLRDDAELVVSELVTNAVAATRGTGDVSPVRLWLLSDRARLLILVWDPCRHSPARIDPAEDEECGRGLLLVESVSTEWDWFATLHPAGKAVWALCE